MGGGALEYREPARARCLAAHSLVLLACGLALGTVATYRSGDRGPAGEDGYDAALEAAAGAAEASAHGGRGVAEAAADAGDAAGPHLLDGRPRGLVARRPVAPPDDGRRSGWSARIERPPERTV